MDSPPSVGVGFFESAGKVGDGRFGDEQAVDDGEGVAGDAAERHAAAVGIGESAVVVAEV